jgi:cytochrome c-type biogenesis protein CcsB
MKNILSAIGSMKTMAVLMLVFAVSIGYATFIENDYGTQTAKAEVYSARWFELLLILLAVNLSYNIVKYKMFQRKKALVFLFHLSFLVILAGAAVTRFVGYEGMMHIREGGTSDKITSSKTYLKAVFDDNGKLSQYKNPLLLSKMSENSFEADVDVDGKAVKIRLLEYIPDAAYTIKADPDGVPIAHMMVTGGGAGQSIQLSKGEFYENESMVLDFNSGKSFDKPVISLFVEEGKLYLNHPMPLRYLKMDDRSSGDLNASEHEPAALRTLFTAGNTNFVVREFYPKAVKTVASRPTAGPMRDTTDALRMEVSGNGVTREGLLFGMPGVVGQSVSVDLAGLRVSLSYGAELITLPFALKLEDFELERYPGSMSPASYASDVVLIDKEEGIEEPFRIYMNHVLDHKGYRFFQSSYDRDEHGTVLSVNHDPGTPLTYLGYLMLAIGIFGSPFMRNGRFRQLMERAEKASVKKSALAVALIALVSLSPSTKAEELNPVVQQVLAFDAKHAEKFGRLITQDSGGRMKPMDTLSTEIVHKLNRGNTVLGLNPNQIVLGMMVRPEAWREIKLIRTGHKEINKIIGIGEKEKTAAFSQFFEFPDEMVGYKLAKEVDTAIRKAPGKRDKFDKAVLKVDERVNVAYMVYTGALLRIWPKPNDENNKWFATLEALQSFPPHEANRVQEIAVQYFATMEEALSSGNWKYADEVLGKIADYQKAYGAEVYPEPLKIKTEIWYNHSNIFERLWPLYFIVGFVLLVLSFVKIIKPSFRLGFFSKSALALLVLFLIVHTAGLLMRWYISGHAPWSNGYESMIYIGWATVLAGFIFSKNSPITLAATAILAGLILFVAHLNWMDPQVTNLVPVLQSYWLSIHVSMITASYGFLGLGALLGFIALILFVIKSKQNEKQISLSIKELNAINEMSLMIGLALLTVGNFLGGVWANESWGRYWGWDPKETWALVTILVYAVVVHLRFIKALYSPYLYSVISLLAFTSVLMTYFGVNYYLAGMHSYAKGDPVPVPDFVPVTYAVVFAIIALAFRNRKLSA